MCDKPGRTVLHLPGVLTKSSDHCTVCKYSRAGHSLANVRVQGMLSHLPRIRRHSGTSSFWRSWLGSTPAPRSTLAWCSSTCSTSWVRLCRRSTCSNTISEALQKAACVDHSLAMVTRSASPKRHMVSIHAGVYPALYAAMLLPAAKSRNNVSTAVRQLFDTVPVATQRPLNGLSTVCSSQLMCTLQIPTAPFVVASFGVGMFSLLPYFALWSPLPREERTLPPKSELVSTTAFQACVPPCEQIVHVFHMYRDLAQPSLGLQAVGDH